MSLRSATTYFIACGENDPKKGEKQNGQVGKVFFWVLLK
jgi:hypothetical protein